MTLFGDFDTDDAAGGTLADVDPEALARILWARLRARAPTRFRVFDAHTAGDRLAIVAAVADVLARLRDEVGGE
jgi:hypothetical protein